MCLYLIILWLNQKEFWLFSLSLEVFIYTLVVSWFWVFYFMLIFKKIHENLFLKIMVKVIHECFASNSWVDSLPSEISLKYYIQSGFRQSHSQLVHEWLRGSPIYKLFLKKNGLWAVVLAASGLHWRVSRISILNGHFVVFFLKVLLSLFPLNHLFLSFLIKTQPKTSAFQFLFISKVIHYTFICF